MWGSGCGRCVKRRGQTQAQTARSVGISRQYLSEAEAGANVTLSVIYRLAEHFGVSAASIVDSPTVADGQR